MCSNPSTRKLTIRPDFDMDVYLHPPSMHRNRIRRVSASSMESEDPSQSPRFSFSSIFSFFRQSSQTEFSTMNRSDASPKPETTMEKTNVIKEEKFQEACQVYNQSVQNEL